MKYAAIDIGSNSVRLLIADVKKDDLFGKKYIISTRIAHELEKTGVLGTEPMARTKKAVQRHVKKAKEFDVELPIYCYATSAVREAENGQEFIQSLFGIDGLKAEILTEDMEAYCSYLGAAAKDNLVLDIGGGSTEVIMCIDKKVCSKSERLGCVTALEKFLHNDPPTKQQLDELEKYCAQYAQQLAHNVPGTIDTIVGVGGTATQLAALDLGLEEYCSQKIDGHKMSKTALQSLYVKLSGLPDSERKKVIGMDATRSDVIVSGLAIALAIMSAYNSKQLVASDKDGLDGYLKLQLGLE